MNDHDVCWIINYFVMDYNPVINGTDLAAAYPLRKVDALRQEQADNFPWLAATERRVLRSEGEERDGRAGSGKVGREPASMLYVCTEGEASLVNQTVGSVRRGREKGPDTGLRRSRDFNRREGGREEGVSKLWGKEEGR